MSVTKLLFRKTIAVHFETDRKLYTHLKFLMEVQVLYETCIYHGALNKWVRGSLALRLKWPDRESKRRLQLVPRLK
jgi:hypothetical protein